MERSMDLRALGSRMRPYRDEMIRFAQKLIQTPSLPGDEGAAAALVQAEMTRLHYDEVRVDEVGNVIGLMRGATPDCPIMLNAHIDHVSVGDESIWPHGPFSGDIVDGELWGRAAVDLKGSVATQVYALGALRELGVQLARDVYVAAVVLEEVGGMGTGNILKRVKPAYCVIGEATGNALSLGHRGVVGMFVEIEGRASHASMVNVGINPHYSAARFLLGLRDLKHVVDPMLGPSTAAPTLYTTDQTSGNVIPGQVRIYVDWRSVPGETPDGVVALADALLQRSLEPRLTGRVVPRQFRSRSYTGIDLVSPAAMIAVKTDPASALATHSHGVLETALGRDVPQIVWRFCTDGSICAHYGVPIIGFGPGDQELAHTSQERVSLAQLEEAMVGNAALALSPA